MKRIMVFWLVLIFPILVFAKEYESLDININLDVNDDYIVLSRDVLEGSEDLEKLNVTLDQMIDIMNNGNIYFDIVKKDISYEILVVVPDVSLPINNLTGISEDVLVSFKDEAAKKVDAKNSSIYKGTYNYIVVDYYDSSTSCYVLNYYTIVDSKGYNFQLQKKSVINDDEKNSLKEIVDSVKFTNLDNEKEENNEQDTVSKRKVNMKNLIYAMIIGIIAGLITYAIGLFISKKKSSK